MADTTKPEKKKYNTGYAGTFLTLTVASITATVLYLAETTWFNYIDNFKFVTRVGLHHPIVPTIATILYLIMIYVGPRVMKKREAIELKYIPLVHNIILSSGSLVVTIAILRDVVDIFAVSGIEGLNCDSAKVHPTTHLYFWFFVFYLSKMYEFIDTAILIARKKSLIFLHTYHHVITLWLCWVCLDDELSMQWLCSVANTIVHVAMYYFYASVVLNVDVWWKRYLTTLQIFQFLVDITANVSWAYYTIIEERVCSGSWFGFWFGMFVIFSFLVLFIQFYINSYKKGPAKKQTDGAAKEQVTAAKEQITAAKEQATEQVLTPKSSKSKKAD